MSAEPDPAPLAIPPDLLDELFTHASGAGSEECCGILLGRSSVAGARVVEARPAANVWPGDRARRYEIRPEDLLAVHREARERDLEVIGFYHSHPAGPAQPSSFDRERAWPGVSYLILAPGRREARCWRVAPGGGRFVEQPVVAPPAG